MKTLLHFLVDAAITILKIVAIVGIVLFACSIAARAQTLVIRVNPSKDTTIVSINTTYQVTTKPTDTGAVIPPTGYTLTYSNNYNVSSDLSSNQLGRGSISTTIFKTGPGSFRSEVRAGDPAISSGWRSEQQYELATQIPIEGMIEYDVYYENWSGFDGGGHSIQWHPYTGGASAIVSLQNYDGEFDVVRSLNGNNSYQQGTLRPVISNHWYHMQWQFKWTTQTTGYVKLFIDGSLYYSFTGKTADGSGQYLKVGQNRWPANNNATTMQTTSVCYYDNLKIYKKV